MALLGKGVLAIWNGITETGEAEFIRWHIREHIPERVGLPGFLRGRRYIAHEGNPKYFNFYETETPQTLQSPAYRARLDAPTPWTQAVVREFRDTSRTICEVVASLGTGEGAWVETIRFGRADDPEILHRGVVSLIKDIAAEDGIVGVHFLRGVNGQGSVPTVESKLRGQPDVTCEWILLVEAATKGSVDALRIGVCSDEAIHRLSSGATAERGTYLLQYALTHAEIGRTG